MRRCASFEGGQWSGTATEVASGVGTKPASAGFTGVPSFGKSPNCRLEKVGGSRFRARPAAILFAGDDRKLVHRIIWLKDIQVLSLDDTIIHGLCGLVNIRKVPLHPDGFMELIGMLFNDRIVPHADIFYIGSINAG
jgi:hypothetical protein